MRAWCASSTDLRAEGDWHDYFSADETVQMAIILAVDTNKMLAQFEQRLQLEPAYHKWFKPDIQQPLHGGYLERLNSPLLVARALDAWVTAVQPLHSHAGQETRSLLEGILRGMKREPGRAWCRRRRRPSSASPTRCFRRAS
jgi:hypothetical protein